MGLRARTRARRRSQLRARQRGQRCKQKTGDAAEHTQRQARGTARRRGSINTTA